MARPKKNNADYFSHDSGMRNHRKIRALRVNFSATGYSVYIMLLELLTDSEYNRIQLTEIEYELIAGDFDVSVAVLKDVICFCIKLELFEMNDGELSSSGLDARLKSVYDKRKNSKELANDRRKLSIAVTNTLKQKHEINRISDTETNNMLEKKETNGVSVTEIQQIEEKEKIVKEIKRFTVPTIAQIKDYCDVRNNKINPTQFHSHYESIGWKVGTTKMKDWKAAIRTWEAREYKNPTMSGQILISKTNEQTVKIIKDAKF